MINAFQLLAAFAILHSLAAALPVKRVVVTRWHTAPTHTNTDIYSTTTRMHVAPTVAYVVNSDVTYTTTLVPPDVDSTAEPVTSTMYGTSAASQPSQAPESSSSPSPSASQWSSPALASTSDTPALAPSSSSSQWSSPAPASTSDTPAPAPSSSSSQWSSPAPASTSDTPALAPSSSSTQWSSPAPASTSDTPAPAPTSSSQQTTTLSPSSSSSSWSSSVSPSSSSSAPSSGSSSGGIPVPTAISYTPYNDDSSCKSGDQVNSDLQEIQSKGIHRIRVYGTDCGAFDNILPAASKLGLKVNQGLWISQDGVDSIDDGVNSLVQYGQQNGWDVFDFVTVGNEAINSGFCNVNDLISKIKSVKSQLNDAGYQGSVITSEPPVSFENNPQLCTDSGIDFVGVNPHSFFDFGISATSAGEFVKGQVQKAQDACGNMKIFVTETGYPSQGDTIGQEVPSEENQRIAINSILKEMNNDVTILSFFDDKWKNPGPYGIEQWFGIENLFN